MPTGGVSPSAFNRTENVPRPCVRCVADAYDDPCVTDVCILCVAAASGRCVAAAYGRCVAAAYDCCVAGSVRRSWGVA